MKINAKRLPTWFQNRCQNSSTVNAKTGTDKDDENHQNHVFLDIGKFVVKTMPFESLARCVRKRKWYQKHIKYDTKIYPQINEKSMQNLCLKK